MDVEQQKKPLRIASICSSNMNRSMEAHLQLAAHGFAVESYGTGTHVKLPGPSADRPNIYEFGTPYSTILTDLKAQDENLYIQNGVLSMLERNVTIKPSPQPWKEAMAKAFGLASSGAEGEALPPLQEEQLCPGQFDVILTFEERVYDAVFESFENLEVAEFSERSVHCINVEVKDSHEEALLGAQDALDLCEKLAAAEDLDEQLSEIVEQWANGSGNRGGSSGGRLKTFWHTFFY